MIKTRSAYNLNIPFVSPLTGATCSEYTVNIYIWDGLKTGVPATPEYSYTKKNFETSTGTDKINIARVINDFIELNPKISASTELISSESQLWVKSEIIYTTTNPADDGVAQLPTTQLALRGYGSGIEGENPQTPSNGILISGDLFRVGRNSTISFPLLFDTSKTITVSSTPDSELSFTDTVAIQADSSDIVQVLNIVSPANDKYIEIDVEGEIINLVVVDEYKYTPVDIYFFNKEGAQQTLTFFKERTDILTTTKEDYESIQGQPSAGYHQFVDYNLQGQTNFTLTSGFVPEMQNESFKQLMLSEKVYLYNDGFVPLNVVKNSLQFQTRLNNRLISYDIEFKYSYSEVGVI